MNVDKSLTIIIWLVVWNIWIMFHFMYGMSSFPLTNSYFSGVGQPPTSHSCGKFPHSILAMGHGRFDSPCSAHYPPCWPLWCIGCTITSWDTWDMFPNKKQKHHETYILDNPRRKIKPYLLVHLGLSENAVPLNPLANHYQSYIEIAIQCGTTRFICCFIKAMNTIVYSYKAS